MKEVRRTNKEQSKTPDGNFSMQLANTTFTVGIYFNHAGASKLEDTIELLLSRAAKECFINAE